MCSGAGAVLQLWDVATGKQKCAYPRHIGAVSSVVFSPDDKTVLTAGEQDYTIRLWDARTGRQVIHVRDGPPEAWNSFRGQDDMHLTRIRPLGRVALSSDGKEAISPCVDGTVRFWDIVTAKENRRIQLEGGGLIHTVAFAPDGKTIAVATEADDDIKLWDLATGKEIRQASTDHGEVFAIAYSPDGKAIASAGGDRAVALWDAKTLRPVRRFGLYQNTGCLAFSPDSNTISVGQRESVVSLWKADGKKFQVSLAHVDRADPEEPSLTCTSAFSAGGSRVVWSGHDGVVRVWDVNRNEEIAQFRGHVGAVMQVAFSRNSRFVASAGQDGTVLVWDVSHIGEK